MLIVTAGSNHNPKYERTIRYCKKECNKYGYKFQVYDLGGLGFGTPISDVRMESKFRTLRYAIKPELVLKSLNTTNEEFVAWIDGDATLIGNIDELEADKSFDIALTVRPKREIKKSNYINAGVFFCKNNDRSKKFLSDWIETLGPAPLDAEKDPKYYCDQVRLEEDLVMPVVKVPLWDVMQSVYEIRGAKVKILNCTQYNNYWSHRGFDRMEYSPSIKILHFKGRHWAATKPTLFEGEKMDILELYTRKFLNERR